MPNQKNIKQNSDRTQIIKAQKKIVRLFNSNVRGKTADTTGSNAQHDGKAGHWLEVQMGIAHNASNTPDIDGFEMKNDTGSKTSFGDWSADYYIYKDEKFNITRDQFLRIFGKSNLKKKGRYSWSGEPCPKINVSNTFGQMLHISENGDIIVIYNFKKDQRGNKSEIVPKSMQKNYLVIARWEKESIQEKLERKFNNLGWFKCLKNTEGVYDRIVFGDPINFKNWIIGVAKGDVFFDSGMYQGNLRNYSQWRANNSYWGNLITSTY